MSEIAPYQQISIVFTASLLYGLYISTLLICYRWLLLPDPDPHSPIYSPQKSWISSWIPHRRRVVCWPMVIVTTWIFALTLVYLVVTLISAMQTVQRGSGSRGGGQGWGSDVWLWTVQCATANFVALLADGVLTFRLYIIYTDQPLIMILPILLWLGGIVCTAIQIWLQVTEISNATAAIPFTSSSWLGSTPSHVNVSLGPGMVLTPFWGAMVVLNAYCTFMLIYKISRASKDTRYDEVSLAEFHFITRIVAESGFLFLSVTIALFVAWFTTNNLAIMIVTAFNVPMIGMTFNIMLIRACSNKSRYNWFKLCTAHNRPDTQNPGSLSEPYSPHLSKPRLTSDPSADSTTSRSDPGNNDGSIRRARSVGDGTDTLREREVNMLSGITTNTKVGALSPSRMGNGSGSTMV